ncbi:MAG: hypothetical protein QM784_37870 [Polyangiaceae bacterium]
MSVWSCLLALPFLACASTQGAPEEEALQTAESALIGGHAAAADEYQATVWVGMCTATKAWPASFLARGSLHQRLESRGTRELHHALDDPEQRRKQHSSAHRCIGPYPPWLD